MNITELQIHLQEKMFELLEVYYDLPMHSFEETARVMDYGLQIIGELLMDGKIEPMKVSDRTLLVAKVSLEVRKMQKAKHPTLR
jgi:hypothetical protein